jgi:hypothetical protein
MPTGRYTNGVNAEILNSLVILLGETVMFRGLKQVESFPIREFVSGTLKTGLEKTLEDWFCGCQQYSLSVHNEDKAGLTRSRILQHRRNIDML